jgi:hypothetical protein
MSQKGMVAIAGNTFPVKDQLRALGGRWNADRKAWMIPVEKVDEAKALIASAPQSPPPRKSGLCKDCGARTKGNYTRCYECSLEYRDGGSRYRGGMSYYDANGHFVLGDDD